MPEPAYVAVDLGAESGRVMAGRISAGKLGLESIHRFANRRVSLPSGLHWDIRDLFAETLSGLRAAAAGAELRSVGVDSWGADYALLDARGEMLGLPFHYRDSRTAGMVSQAHGIVARDDLYAVTGIQTMSFNTVFQLLAERKQGNLIDAAKAMALIPDLFNYWLTGELVNEATAASTTALLDASSGDWARDLAERLGIPASLFTGAVVEPGACLGSLRGALGPSVGEAVGVGVHAVAAHDTASAFVAAPLRDPHAAILSSGTWSILGLELPGPVLSAEACAFNLSNERGIDGTFRLLGNVMGLWLIQQCRSHWQQDGRTFSYSDLRRLAEAADPSVSVFDPDDPRFLPPGDMPARIAAACVEASQSPPRTAGECIRSALVSLTCKYRFLLERLEAVSGRSVHTVHVIGGGARNALLCQLTATMLGRPVVAGPVEATAIGNILVQARAQDEIGSLAELRALVAASIEVAVFEPEVGSDPEGTYARFLTVTGLPPATGPRSPGLQRSPRLLDTNAQSPTRASSGLSAGSGA